MKPSERIENLTDEIYNLKLSAFDKNFVGAGIGLDLQRRLSADAEKEAVMQVLDEMGDRLAKLESLTAHMPPRCAGGGLTHDFKGRMVCPACGWAPKASPAVAFVNWGTDE